jgi:hypothetical protein
MREASRTCCRARRLESIMGGTWEPPCAEVAAAASDRTARAAIGRVLADLGLRAVTLARAGSIMHVLSHRRMRVDVLRGRAAPAGTRAPFDGDYDAVDVVDPKSGERGITSLTRKILRAATSTAFHKPRHSSRVGRY